MANKKSDTPAPKGSFRQLVDHKAKANWWKPKAIGDALFGTLKKCGTTDNGPFVMVELFSGEKILFGLPTQLKDDDYSPYIGKGIKFVLKVFKETKKGNPAKLFDVFVED